MTACEIEVEGDRETSETVTTKYRISVTCRQCKNVLRGRA